MSEVQSSAVMTRFYRTNGPPVSCLERGDACELWLTSCDMLNCLGRLDLDAVILGGLVTFSTLSGVWKKNCMAFRSAGIVCQPRGTTAPGPSEGKLITQLEVFVRWAG